MIGKVFQGVLTCWRMMIKPKRGIIITEIIPEETKIGSIYIARTKKEIPRRAKVISVGLPETTQKGKEIKPCADEGDIVYVKRYAGQQITEPDTRKKLLFLHNEDIVARVVT